MKLTSSEASVAATITMAKLRRNAPTIPVMKMIGPQTATSTRVIAMAAIPISERPLTAACFGSSPCSSLLKMFSSTTMLSSTSTPMAVVSAISVMPLRVSPTTCMTISATSSEDGIASSTIRVLRTLCRKKNSTTPVMIAASSSSCWTSSTVSRT